MLEPYKKIFEKDPKLNKQMLLLIDNLKPEEKKAKSKFIPNTAQNKINVQTKKEFRPNTAQKKINVQTKKKIRQNSANRTYRKRKLIPNSGPNSGPNLVPNNINAPPPKKKNSGKTRQTEHIEKEKKESQTWCKTRCKRRCKRL